MGWFENQIEERRKADQEILEEAFMRAAGVVLGKKTGQRIRDERIVAREAIGEILKYYHFKAIEIPNSVKTIENQLDYALRPYGMMSREVELREEWYKDSFGPILAFMKESGTPVALLPNRGSGYYYTDSESGKHVKLDKNTSALFDTDAVCFYRPLPLKKLGIRDLLVYIKNCVSMRDGVQIVLATAAVTLVGLLLPRMSEALTGPVLESGEYAALAGAAICLFCILLSSQLLTMAKKIINVRLSAKTSLGVEASMMMRILSLPAAFFRKYSPGELWNRAASINSLCSLLTGIVVTTGLASITSLLYIMQIFQFTPMLAVPSLIIVLITVGFSAISIVVQVRINRRKMEIDAKEAGMSYSIINGVQKIKLAGAEKRIFARWLNLYSDGAELKYNPPMFIKINSVISTSISLISTIVLYYLAAKSGVDQSTYFAFTTAYGLMMGAFMSVAQIALEAAQIPSILSLCEPFLKAEPETASGKSIVTKISGGIEFGRVSFRYSNNDPYILNDLSFKVRPGEYVAIVGKTGCGKSTLIRLMLGFEKPEKGAIYLDGKDMNGLDMPSLRRKIGVVMQDAGLFQGSIYENIVISAPELSMEDAWEAAEKAGIADDIREMPMGMHTMISEGQGSISGGQRQRIMIARAIAPKPKLLIFDEATSALDNKTQKQVSDALGSMGCTRIVVAHRLSTIKQCDRIMVLDGGKIIESGTYESLIEKGGFFAELVDRQRVK